MSKKRILSIFLLILFNTAAIFAAETVDFYSTVSSSDDKNMINMTTDMFYSKFIALSGYSVNDKRKIPYDSETAFKTNISFYIEIQESEEGWICTLNAIKEKTKIITSTKKYDSYYKILMDSKPFLENLLENLSHQENNPMQKETVIHTAVSSADFSEQLPGTWTGENFIEKILILRGGRGFVIFKNGASMNIKIETTDSEITITQNGKNNASFYPDLPRETVLKNISQAEPIEWKLSFEDDTTLKGTKRTLIADNSSETGARESFVSVIWKKN